MKCKICGAELGIDEKICHECGNPIEEQNPSGTEENNQGEEEWTEAEACQLIYTLVIYKKICHQFLCAYSAIVQ